MQNQVRLTGLIGAIAALVVSTAAYAGSVDLAGGWRASWDPALDGLVDILDNGSVAGATFFQKTAEFLDGSVNGIFPSIEITFTQIDADAVGTLVIQDEIITNSTGEDWTDFHLEVNGGDAAFDPIATANSPGPLPIGWAIAPFQQAQFANGDTLLDIFEGKKPLRVRKIFHLLIDTNLDILVSSTGWSRAVRNGSPAAADWMAICLSTSRPVMAPPRRLPSSC